MDASSPARRQRRLRWQAPRPTYLPAHTGLDLHWSRATLDGLQRRNNGTFSGHRAVGAERDKPRRAELRAIPQLLRVPRGLIRSAVVAFGVQFFGVPVEQFQIMIAAPAFELTFCIRSHGAFDPCGALLCARQGIDDP